MKMQARKALLLLAATVALTACNQAQEPQQVANTDIKMWKEQEKILSRANDEVGLPDIKNYQEKRNLKTILEMRDQNIETETYLVAADSKLVKFCDSVGFGIPYSTQYTSPEKWMARNEALLGLPQADPNGLFTIPAASTEGSWVFCKGKDKTLPVYIEQRVVITPIPLAELAK